MPKLFLTALSLGDALSAVDASNALVRSVRQADRSLVSSDVVALPLVDGCSGTLEFLVGHTLGSYLEVEATDATGDQAIVPIGLCGSDERLAVLELQSIAGVDALGDRGTTFGVGELMQDALDEGAFSVLLAHEEPIARDAGLGLAAALGVKFFDATGAELDMRSPNVDLSRVASIDATGRSFETLSARFFVARSTPLKLLDAQDQEFQDQLRSLAQIVKRDLGLDIPVDTLSLSKSGVEFGLIAFLSAAIREGSSLVTEASEVLPMIESTDSGALLVLARDEAQLAFSEALQPMVQAAIAASLPIVFLFANAIATDTLRQIESRCKGAEVRSLQDVTLFQPPLTASAKPDEVRRNLLMRLDKLVPDILTGLKQTWSRHAVV